jgi:hypothetical protein
MREGYPLLSATLESPVRIRSGEPVGLAAAVQPVFVTVDPNFLDGFAGALGRVAVVAHTRPFLLFPLWNRNTVTKRVVIGLLAFSNRNISFGCYALKSIRSPHFIAFVTVLRFGDPF